jgi:hypothetical protein
MARLLLSFFSPNLFRLLRMKTVDSAYAEFITRIVNETEKQRELEGSNTKDFLQLLLQLKNSGEVVDDDNQDWSTKTAVSGMFMFKGGVEINLFIEMYNF